MAKEKKVPLEKVTVNLTEGDKDILEKFYHTIGWSVALRQIVRRHCAYKEEEDSQTVQAALDTSKIDLGSINNMEPPDAD